MLVQNCCGCSLKHGCLVIAYLSLTFSALLLVDAIAVFFYKSWEWPSHLPPLALKIIDVIDAVAGLIFSSIFLVGIYKENKKLVLVFFVGTIVIELICLSLGLDFIIACFGKKKYAEGSTLLVGSLAILALVIYVLIVVYSYYKSPVE